MKVFKLNKFVLTVHNQKVLVNWMKNNVFHVQVADIFLGSIFFEITNSNIKWYSKNGIKASLVSEIGQQLELIMQHNELLQMIWKTKFHILL